MSIASDPMKRYYSVTSLRSFKITFTIILITLVCALVYMYRRHLQSERAEALYALYQRYGVSEGHDEECQFATLNPWDPSILRYLKNFSQPLQCSKLQPDLVFYADGHLYVNETEALMYELGDVDCQGRCIQKDETDFAPILGNWEPFINGSLRMQCDATMVDCYSRALIRRNVYSYAHLHIVPKEPFINMSSTSKGQSGPAPNRPNVVILIVDSMSRSNFIRQLPITYRTLIHEMQGVEFKLWMKTGDNSYPNAIPMLTGHPVGYAGFPNQLGPYDDWPLVWRDFEAAGYVTMFQEDMPKFQLFASYGGLGFRHQPTTHYSRPFWSTIYSTFLHLRSSVFCYGSQAKHNIQLAYLRDLLDNYPRRVPRFTYSFISEISHEDINRVGAADQDLAAFLDHFNAHYANDTFLFMFGDHGHRFDAIRQTVVGRYEERLPFVSLVVPTYFRQRHARLMANLRENAENRVTSWFDLHATMRAILTGSPEDPTYPATTPPAHPGSNSAEKPKGQSIFQPLSKTRTCQEAGVPDDYCVCQHYASVPTSEILARTVATCVVDHINGVLLHKQGPKCATLQLNQIRNCQIFVPRSYIAEPAATLLVTLETQPGSALFEAKVLYQPVANTCAVQGDVQRINRYGNQSACTDDKNARLYCYCV